MSLKEKVIVLLIFDALVNQTPTRKGYNDINWAKVEPHRGDIDSVPESRQGH